MTRVIKSTSLSEVSQDVRAFGAPAYQAPPSATELELATLKARVARLEQSVVERDQYIAELEPKIAGRFEEGLAQGRAEGLRMAQTQESERLELLRDHMRTAASDLSANLNATERLAALLARECLDRLFGDGEQRTHVVIDLIRHQMAEIETGTVLSIEVSTSDFPDDAALSALRTDAFERVQLIRRDLPIGACRMRLKLGEIEIGLDQQWGTLRQLLSDMASQDADG